MKALVKVAPGEGNLEIVDVPEPACPPDGVKVEVAFCGVCGTDLHVMHDTFPNYPPVILGHEIAGRVVETGHNVAAFRPGDAVTVLGATSVTCGQCRYCRSGYFLFCPKRRGMGHGVNGGFTRYVVVRPDQLFRVPDGFGIDEAALSEPFAAAVQAVAERTDVRPGDTVLVSGPGPIGLLCLKLLIAQGVRTFVAGAAADRARLQAAKAIGAADVVNTGEIPLAEWIREQTREAGVDVAFECAGHPASVRGCVEALGPMGRYTQVAICGGVIPFPIDLVLYKQLTMVGSVCYTEETWRRMMNIFANGRIRCDDLISAKLPITDWRTGFNMCERKEGVKVLLHPAG